MTLNIARADLNERVIMSKLAAKLVGGVNGVVEHRGEGNEGGELIKVSANAREMRIALRIIHPYLAYWNKG